MGIYYITSLRSTPAAHFRAAGFFYIRLSTLEIHITRPVVISTAKGFRHFVPGTQVDVPQAEAEQILRQQAGNSVADRPVIPLIDDATRKKKTQGLTPCEPKKGRPVAIQADPALLADVSILAASVDFGEDSDSNACGDSAGSE